MTAVVRTALRSELAAERRKRNIDDVFRDLMEISERAANLPDSGRPLTDFLAYDENGLPV